ncbi:MAG: hypothetical protein DRH76_10535 [Deltaproteobacteria bacterium]|nr:MAG: hypothetical protein DRH76_10535 [Deltaproteobacteria bacterium]
MYLHCRGGSGRTGTVVGGCLVRRGLADAHTVVDQISRLREDVATKWPRLPPETRAQIEFVRSWPGPEKNLQR